MDWYYALCQHPMYLIIEEDDQAAERVPPWGEPTIDGYIDRIRRNLASLQQYPHLKLNYDFSGVELERLAARAPDLIEQLRQAYAEKRISFVNGSYSQAHLHTLGAESNLRQLQYGLATIERIIGQRVRTYAHQEPAVHDQMPQILQALGYRYAVTPSFFYVIVFLDPHEIQGVQYQGLRYMEAEEFTMWQGLDGQQIPLYLSQPRILPKGGIHGSESHAKAVRTEYVKDTLRYPPLRCDFPDMVEIDEAWIADLADHEHVIIESALDERMRKWPPKSRARIYSYWGSGDGLNAEELHRSNRAGEIALLRASASDALAASLLPNWQPSDLDHAWRQLLAAQHHDAYWVGAPVLRSKACGWARESASIGQQAAQAAHTALAEHIDTTAQPGDPVLLVEPWPVSRSDVALIEYEVPIGTTAVTARNAQGEALPSQIIERLPDEATNHERCIVAVHQKSHGFGYQTVWLSTSDQAPALQTDERATISTAFYQATIEANGTISSLQLPGNQRELIQANSSGGNTLRCQDEHGAWQEFRANGPLRISRGPLADIVEVSGSIVGAALAQRFIFHKCIPRIDVRLTFDFDATSIGNFWIDTSKLNVYWPVAPRGQIWHDIPFGTIAGRESRPFFALTWLRLGDQHDGLAYFNRGTVRHHIEDNVLGNVLACGVFTDDIGTRARPEPYAKAFDLRLRGRHVIEYAVYPHHGDWQSAQIPLHALQYQYPLASHQMQRQRGTLAAQQSLATFAQPYYIPTAVWHQDGRLHTRFFDSYGRAGRPDLGRSITLRALDGQPITEVRAFGIAEAILER
jgi:hypothetical protein